MRVVSQRALQAMMAQNTAEVFLPCLRVDHPSFQSPILLTYNTQAIQRAAGTYQPFGFTMNLPDQQEDSLPNMSVTFDCTDLSIIKAIRGLSGQPSVEFDVVLASQPDVVEAGPYSYDLLNATADSGTVQGHLGFDSGFWDQSVPALDYTPSNSRGLYV